MFTSAEIFHAPRAAVLSEPKKIGELRALLDSFPGRWSRSKDSEPKTGMLILLKRDSAVMLHLYVGSDWIAFQAADARMALAAQPRFEKKISPSDSERVMRYFEP